LLIRVHGLNKMGKGIKTKKKKGDKNMTITIAILAIMVLSVLGYAVSTNTGGSNSGNNGVQGQDVPFQYFDQYGVWAAVKGGTQFVFQDISTYQNMTNMKNIAMQLKGMNHVDVYVDDGFTYDTAVYLIETQLFGAFEIGTQRITDKNCNAGTLVFTTNASAFQGDCMVFASNDSADAADMAYGLQYYMLIDGNGQNSSGLN